MDEESSMRFLVARECEIGRSLAWLCEKNVGMHLLDPSKAGMKSGTVSKKIQRMEERVGSSRILTVES